MYCYFVLFRHYIADSCYMYLKPTISIFVSCQHIAIIQESLTTICAI
jgi:hypothetical protein